jgi:dipeptidyl aminopeptidase/acylaminoacyl peptidase
MSKQPITPEDLLRLKLVGDPQISPDGSRVLFTHKSFGDKYKSIANLYSVAIDGEIMQWTQGEDGAGNGRWSPDGRSIAFVSGRAKPASQIYLISVKGGEAKKLTDLPEGSIGGFKWSPDSKLIAFTFREQDPDWTEKAKKEREEKGLSTPPRVIENAWYRLDGDGYFGAQRHAIYVLDVASGEHRKVYDKCPMGMYGFDWAPNSNELAVIHTVNERPLAQPENDQVFRVGLDGKASMLEGLPKGPKSGPAWSPDGNSIAYYGDDHEENPWGVYNSKLFVAPASGGSVKCLTREDDYCLTVGSLSDTREGAGDGSPIWSPDSKALYVHVGWHGEVQLGFVQLDISRVKLLTKGKHAISVGNMSRDGEKFACLFGDAVKPAEIAVYDLAKHHSEPAVVTHFNDDFVKNVNIAVPVDLWLDTPDKTKVHVWVMRPVDVSPTKRTPAVLEIHGGPHMQYGWAFFHEFQVLAAQGYTVVYSNPRGSKGYGEKHCDSIRGAWGEADWTDIKTVIDWMKAQPTIDPAKMGVMGGSYGGYMTDWVVGHTDVFKAAITDRCVSNLVSMGGSSDFPFTEDSYWKGAPWGDITSLWAQSPIAYFGKVSTPMLIIHSEGDLRCNIEQGEQVFSALQQRGIESRFVRYPASTSHGLSRGGPADLRIHRLNEIVNWWAKHLG